MSGNSNNYPGAYGSSSPNGAPNNGASTNLPNSTSNPAPNPSRAPRMVFMMGPELMVFTPIMPRAPPTDGAEMPPSAQPMPPTDLPHGVPPPMFFFDMMDPRFMFFTFPMPMGAPDQAPHLQGQPHTAPKVLEELPKTPIAALSESDGATPCAICHDALNEVDDANRPTATVVTLPCSHAFHTDCVTPWLANSNLCPCCRYPLDTDNPEYNTAVVAPARAAHVAARGACAMAALGLCDGKFAQLHTVQSLPCGCRVCSECIDLQRRLTPNPAAAEFPCPSCRKYVSPPVVQLPSPPLSPSKPPMDPPSEADPMHI